MLSLDPDSLSCRGVYPTLLRRDQMRDVPPKQAVKMMSDPLTVDSADFKVEFSIALPLLKVPEFALVCPCCSQTASNI